MSLIRLLGIAKKYENQPVLREVFFRLATQLLIFDHAGGTQLFAGNWSMCQGASGQEKR